MTSEICANCGHKHRRKGMYERREICTWKKCSCLKFKPQKSNSAEKNLINFVLSEKRKKLFERLKLDDVRIKALNPETLDILFNAFENQNKEFIRRLKEEFKDVNEYSDASYIIEKLAGDEEWNGEEIIFK